ncbi:translation initiation factor IF-2 [Alicyclobacillus cycloheptanicus]|nr:translation initiation factor IF-2 [Alicyclobacillus cycloheptanicus]
MSSKEIITILNRLDVPVANHMSVMDDSMVQKVEQFFSDVKQRAAQRHATEVERELREKQRQRERAARQARQAEEQRAAQARQQEAKLGLGAVARPAGAGSPLSTGATRMDAGTTAGRSESQGSGADRAASMNRPRDAAVDVSTETAGAAGTAPHGRDHQEGATTVQSANTGAATTNEDRAAHRDSARAENEAAAPQNGGEGTARAERSANPSGERSVDRAPARTTGDRAAAPGAAGGPRRDARGPAGADRGPRSGQGGGYSNDRGPRSGQGGGYSSDRGPRSGQGGGYSNDRGPRGGQGGGYSNDRGPRGGQGGGYSSDRGPRGGQSGGYGGNRSGQSSGFGGNRGGQSGGYGGNRGGQSSGFGGNRGGQSGGFGGNRSGQGGGFGGRSAAGPVAAATKPTAGGLRKDKDKDRAKADFDRNRKEQFNEEKLRGRRRGRGQSGRSEQRRQEFPTEVTVEGPMSVGDFAKLLKREASEVIKKLLFLGIMATINQEIDTDAMELIAEEFGVKLTVTEPVDEEALDMLIEEDKPEDLKPRPPVVTIMGHVDHGKTTLLDAIRESKVVASEAGGITQHIGAYQVEINDRKITFLDTPGHEAFTTMRARGAQVTDVTILVVAADDGVMPQTIEAINHAKAANVPIIVAVNKIDKPNANPDRVKQELTQHGLVPEEWGGDTVFAHISALKREGLDTLLEMVLLVADLQDLKANPTGRPRGTVIEARLDKGRGPVATVLVQNGTLKVGDIVVAGTSFGRVRAMINDLGKRVKEAGPSTPVEIQGFGDVPSAGDLFVVYDDERAARNLVNKRMNREKVEQMQVTSRVTLDDLYKQIQEGNVKELNVIVKADVQGSVEALVQSIEKIDVSGVRVKVIHKGAGAITESDVALASASNAIIIGFHVRPDVNAQRAAESEKVDIRLYRVIYNVIEELESAMKGLLEPEYREAVLGHAEVRDVFKISRVGTVAGCYVTDGKIVRDAEARLIRDGIVVYEGSLESLKRFKDDVREVASGFECGITLEKFNDIKVGDVVEVFKMEAVKVQ